MGIKEASSYVRNAHGGWRWWALKVIVTGAGLAALFSEFRLSRFFI